MFDYFFECFFIALGCGVIGAVYRGILAYETILNWWFRFGSRFEKRWFYEPMWGCVKCITGQLALWWFLFLEIIPRFLETQRPVMEISTLLFGLLFTICGAILTAIILALLITKLENR
jgi:hypothetical protein